MKKESPARPASILTIALALTGALPAAPAPSPDRPPKVVVIFADDLGYGDKAP
jgi:hypothetical protein